MAKKRESLLTKLIKAGFVATDHNKTTRKTLMTKEKIKCLECGNTWNCLYFSKASVYQLECPKCHKRNSTPIG